MQVAIYTVHSVTAETNYTYRFRTHLVAATSSQDAEQRIRATYNSIHHLPGECFITTDECIADQNPENVCCLHYVSEFTRSAAVPADDYKRWVKSMTTGRNRPLRPFNPGI